MTHLFTVADCFQITGRGCILVPGLSTEPGAPNIGRNSKIRLRTPSAAEIDTFIKEIEMITYRKRPEKITVPILLPNNITKEQVPPGTKAFLLDENFEKIGNTPIRS